MLDAALEYAMAGWPVFPVRGKAPTVQRGVHAATTDMDQLRRWMDGPEAGTGLGLACGGVRDLLVIDVDPRNGGMETLASLREKYGAFPSGPVARTGGGGWHLYLRGLSAKSSLGPGVDVKAGGGYVVAPPSIHASGAAYSWAAGRSLHDVDISPAPPWVLEDAPGAAGGDVFAPAPDGGRNNRLASLAGLMLSKGFSLADTTDLMLGWATRCRPPLPSSEVVRTVRSVAKSRARALTRECSSAPVRQS